MVSGTGQITPRMRLIRLAGPELLGLAWTPGQQVREQVRERVRGWPRRSVLVKPFWAPGKGGLE